MMVWSLFIIGLMGLFFNKRSSIIPTVILPTTEIIEPFNLVSLRSLGSFLLFNIRQIHILEIHFHASKLFFIWCDAQGFLASIGDESRLATSWFVEFSDFNHVHLDQIRESGLGEVGR